MTHAKRISSGYGKEKKWIAVPHPGPHPKGQSIPLLLVIRDLLDYADNAKEAKRIINQGLVLVDKKVRRHPNYGMGLMDTLEIPKINKYFRVMPGKKGLELKEISKKESDFKLCKIVNKTIVGNGKFQLSLHDGTTILTDKGKYKTNDTLVTKLPDCKIVDVLNFEKNNTAMVVRGRHSGEVNKITEVLKGTKTRKSLTGVGEIQTLTDYVFVIGKKTPLISI